MSTREEKKFKNQIIDLLKSKKSYEPTVDDVLIQELVDWMKISEASKDDLQTRGLMINVRKSSDEPFYQLNQSIGSLNKSSSMIQEILKTLNLTPNERNKLMTTDNKALDVHKFMNE